MSTRLLFMAVLSMLGGSAVADIFLLGDVTPIFYLAPEVSLPHEDIPSHVVEGNQDLFLRFANTNKHQPTRVLFRSGDRFGDYAVLELQAFYTGRNIGFEEVDSFSSGSPSLPSVGGSLSCGGKRPDRPCSAAPPTARANSAIACGSARAARSPKCPSTNSPLSRRWRFPARFSGGGGSGTSASRSSGSAVMGGSRQSGARGNAPEVSFGRG